MSPADPNRRPDYPIEAARRARLIAQDALAIGQEYLSDEHNRHPSDRGTDFRQLRATLDDVLDQLGALRDELNGEADAPVPVFALTVFEKADRVLVDLIALTFIEDASPRLHGPQTEFRASWRAARKAQTPRDNGTNSDSLE